MLIEGLNEGSELIYIFTEGSDLRFVMKNCRDCCKLSEVHVSSSGSEYHTNIGWKAL